MVAIVEASDGADGCEDEKVIPEIIPLDIGKETPVHAVVGNYKKRVVTIANNGNGEENYEPGRTKRNADHGQKYGEPTKSCVDHGALGTKYGQFTDTV